jgi:hypothetical protein
MANRSDFVSVLPRSIKRVIALGINKTDSHYTGMLRRNFIEAHDVEKKAVKKREKMVVDVKETE